ncbi:hypothetical protein VTK56DRAFT_6835 [Thermocarpiscus australiensis]
MAHHEPFRSLGPLSWTDDICGRDRAALSDLLTTTLANAQLLIDSIPTPTTTPPTKTTSSSSSSSSSSSTSGPRRARSQTDPPRFTTPDTKQKPSDGKHENETVQKLRREWKDLRVAPSASTNPHGIVMHKLAARDGKGAWFARRSLHRSGRDAGSVTFDKWEAALRREMQVTLDRVERENGKEPGTGNIRGIGAERRVGRVDVDGGSMELYQVSVRFPGPTTPRDFITLIMMPREEKEHGSGKDGKVRRPRQFMVVSRPCEHPDCPPRPGFVRGQYESVEVIREVPVEKPLRRTRSSIDFSRDELDGVVDGRRDGTSKEAALCAAKKAVGDGAESEGEQGKAVSFSGSPINSSEGGDEGEVEMAVEWLMVTRSDPGGSVPRFMVEKGTPGGVINDAGRFLKWLSSQTMEDLAAHRTASQPDGVDQVDGKPTGESPVDGEAGQLPANTSAQDHVTDGETAGQEKAPPPSGIYGLFTSALSAATSAVSSTVAAFAPSVRATDSEVSDDESDASSVASFASAEEGSASAPESPMLERNNSATDAASTQSAHSTLSENLSQTPSRERTPSVNARVQHEKELRKLQQRMRKAQEKIERAQIRRRSKNNGNGSNDNNTTTIPEEELAREKEKDDQALAKLREKHEREIAKQEEKYRRELKRLADKRAAEERKAEERRRKAAEREERANLQMALERARAERDVARKEMELLRRQVGELQAQNTMLVARLGREGREAVLKNGGGGGEEARLKG